VLPSTRDIPAFTPAEAGTRFDDLATPDGCTAGFICGWSVGVELVAGLPERPGSQQRHFLQAPKGVCSVLIYVQRIRGFTTMRYINLRFTYLLTYLRRIVTVAFLRRV